MILGMHQAGMEVRVFADLESVHIQKLRDAGIPVRHFPWKKRIDRAALRAVRECVLKHGIQIIHTGNSRTTMHMVLATRPLARRRQSPRLVAYLGVTGNVSWLSPISWLRFLNPRIDRIVCVARRRPAVPAGCQVHGAGAGSVQGRHHTQGSSPGVVSGKLRPTCRSSEFLMTRPWWAALPVCGRARVSTC